MSDWIERLGKEGDDLADRLEKLNVFMAIRKIVWKRPHQATTRKRIFVWKGTDMRHAREDYNAIQDTTAARQLAELVLSMQMATDKGLVARKLAREVLGIDDHGNAPDALPITTNGTTRLIPRDEPVFLLRGQDVAAAGAVRAWAILAEANGAKPEILSIAREHADRMDAWAHKKVPDLAGHLHTRESNHEQTDSTR